jgi:RNA 3'-terminal phosphate cyclase (ATP)
MTEGPESDILIVEPGPATGPVHLNGAAGEGGGQILRSALALSVVTGRPFTISGIRAGRARPGLLRQHLTAVRAAAAVGGATVTGDAVGSTELAFTPAGIAPGAHAFAIGTAGSTSLVMQTVLPPLLVAGGPSEVRISGGTHNPYAPTVTYLQRCFLPVLRRIFPGAALDVDLVRPGFFPAGGGEIVLRVEPAAGVPIELLRRGTVQGVQAVATICNLDRSIGEREVREAARRLELAPEDFAVEQIAGATGEGNVLHLIATAEDATEVVTGFGERGVRAEKVAARAAGRMRQWLAADVPVGPFLADQLILPMAMAGGGTFRTGPLTLHALTNLQTVSRFLPVRARVHPDGKDAEAGAVRVEIRPTS